jgi:hypothetical protein
MKTPFWPDPKIKDLKYKHYSVMKHARFSISRKRLEPKINLSGVVVLSWFWIVMEGDVFDWL